MVSHRRRAEWATEVFEDARVYLSVMMGGKGRALLVLAVAMVAALVIPAAAFADVEPNNGITEAEGPLAGAVAHSGTIANANDVDTYFFYVSGQQQLDIRVTNTFGNCLEARLGDTDNTYLTSVGYLQEAETEDIKYTTPPGVNRYYLRLSGECGQEVRYTVTITPGGGLVGGPATSPGVPTGEPNENAEEAIGPLLAYTAYAGEIQTQNDEDWFKFYTAPGTHQFDIAYTEINSVCDPEVELKGPDEEEDDWDVLSIDEWQHFNETSPSAGVYYLRFYDGCVGARYQFVISPPEALTTGVPTPVSPAPAPAPTPPPPAPKVHRGYAIAGTTAKVANGEALLGLTCAGAGDCAGTVSLVAHANGDPADTFTIGGASFALARGASATLPVKLTSHGMGLLHLSADGRIHVHLSGHDVKGGSLVLSGPHPKQHRRHHRKRHRRRHR
jgi:hypothetical protein